MVIMEEENIKLFNEEEKNISKKIPKKPSKIRNIWRVSKKNWWFKKDNTQENLSDTTFSDFLIFWNRRLQIYYRANIETKIQDSVVNEETYKETQGQANHESRKSSAPVVAAPDPSTGPEAPPEEILPIHIYGNPLRTNLLMNVLQKSDVKVNASIQSLPKLNLKSLVSLK